MMSDEPSPSVTAPATPPPLRPSLRLKAEARLLTDAARLVDEQLAHLPTEELQQTLHELRVHQIELEMQNEELRQAHVDLDAARARWFDLYELAPVGYCTVSALGIIVQANLTLATLLGVPRKSLTHRPFSHLVAADDQSAYYLARKQIVADGVPQSIELRLVRPDDQVWWARLTLTAALDAQSGPELRIVVSDVTARRQAEEASTVLQSQLQQAQKMESIGRLAGGVAHDYNNMLAVILGYTELALLHADDAALRDDLTEIHRAATRSAALTQQLLTFARKQVIQPRELDLNSTAAHALSMLRPLLGEHVRVAWLPAEALWPVSMDAMQVDQILTNLCLNARDAIAGTGTIRIATANCTLDATQCAALRESPSDASPGDFVVMSVTDDGCGMSPETLERVFEPFYTTKAVGAGTGLGLASVYGAVRQNGGFIHVCSTLGEGTAFKLYLPRSHAGLAVEPITDPSKPSRRGQEMILVVEDEPAVRQMTVRALQRQGYTVIAAAHPRDAMQLAREHGKALDLLLTDVRMPEMSGPALATRLQASHPALRVLYMSGYANDGVAFDGSPDGPLPFIAKPFSLAGLTDRVREVLDRA